MYFLAIIVVNQVPGALASGFYYLSILTGMVLFYANRRTFGLRPLVLMAMGAGLLCLINTYVVGNNTEVRSAIMTASFFVAALMLDEEVDERTYLVAMYLNAMVVLAKVALHGTKAPVYAGSSNNYVSIHLLVPIILYYSLLDARGKKIPLVHSCVVWVLCLMAGGRGGLLAATILVAGVILRLYLADEATRRDRVKLGFLLVLIMIPVLIVLLKMMTEYLSDLYVIDRFMCFSEPGWTICGGFDTIMATSTIPSCLFTQGWGSSASSHFCSFLCGPWSGRSETKPAYIWPVSSPCASVD